MGLLLISEIIYGGVESKMLLVGFNTVSHWIFSCLNLTILFLVPNINGLCMHILTQIDIS